MYLFPVKYLTSFNGKLHRRTFLDHNFHKKSFKHQEIVFIKYYNYLEENLKKDLPMTLNNSFKAQTSLLSERTRCSLWDPSKSEYSVILWRKLCTCLQLPSTFPKMACHNYIASALHYLPSMKTELMGNWGVKIVVFSVYRDIQGLVYSRKVF